MKTASGVRYYGKRYYDSRLGRFINRDPKEEAGGLNLYGFCLNNAINRYDIMGNDSASSSMAYYQGLMGVESNWRQSWLTKIQTTLCSSAPACVGTGIDMAAIAAWGQERAAANTTFGSAAIYNYKFTSGNAFNYSASLQSGIDSYNALYGDAVVASGSMSLGSFASLSSSNYYANLAVSSGSLDLVSGANSYDPSIAPNSGTASVVQDTSVSGVKAELDRRANAAFLTMEDRGVSHGGQMPYKLIPIWAQSENYSCYSVNNALWDALGLLPTDWTVTMQHRGDGGYDHWAVVAVAPDGSSYLYDYYNNVVGGDPSSYLSNPLLPRPSGLDYSNPQTAKTYNAFYNSNWNPNFKIDEYWPKD